MLSPRQLHPVICTMNRKYVMQSATSGRTRTEIWFVCIAEQRRKLGTMCTLQFEPQSSADSAIDSEIFSPAASPATPEKEIRFGLPTLTSLAWIQLSWPAGSI